MPPYICHRYYRVINNEKVLLKHYVIGPTYPMFMSSSTAIMLLSDWKDDLTFEDISKLCLVDTQKNREDVVYLDVVQEILNGCIHYPLNCRVICPKCNKEYSCRICHNDDLHSECEEMDRFSITLMHCLLCDKVGPIGMRCSHCNGEVAKSFCPKCNYISMVSPEVKPFFHCDSCGFCRVGKYGEHKHCDICNQCYKKQFFDTHVCDPTDYVCCICQEELKTSIYDHCEVGCGNRHYIHIKCFSSLISSHSYTCPLCRKLFLSQKDLKKLTSQYSRFFILCLLVDGYVSPISVGANDQSNMKAYIGTQSSSSSDHQGEEDKESEETEKKSSTSSHEDHDHIEVQQDNNVSDGAIDGEFFFFSEEICDTIKALFNMDIAMFVINMDRFMATERIYARCRQCSKCFGLPRLNLLNIPCVYCGLFNIDIISSNEANTLQTEDEFVSTWRTYIEGYQLNVKKHTLDIRETLNYLSNHFAQLAGLN